MEMTTCGRILSEQPHQGYGESTIKYQVSKNTKIADDNLEPG
jgi:hypothetical protein